MTQRAPLLQALLLIALLAVGAGWPDTGAQADDNSDWVAWAGGRTLTRDRLGDAVVWRVRLELLERGSGPLTILRQLVEESGVIQEARRLGIVVTRADVEAEYRALDRKVRIQGNGAKTLLDVIVNEQNSSLEEFMAVLTHQMRKERIAGHERHLGRTLPKDDDARIAQIEVVISQLMEKVVVEYGIPTALQNEPTPLQPGVVARVNGLPLTKKEFGEALVMRLPSSRIKQVIHEECKAAITSELALTVEQMDTVIAEARERWNQVRELSTQEALRSVSYEDYVKMRYRLDLESLKRDRYFRGLFGLIQSSRAGVSEADVLKEYEENRVTLYGERILVTDVQIAFAGNNPLLGGGGGRTRKEALQLANAILRRAGAGVPFEQITREVNAKRDRTFRAQRLRVRNTDNERLLYSQAKQLPDGQVSRPFETLSEVHILQRERLLEAPAFEEVQSLIKETIATQRAHEWLEKQLEDENVVRVNWPQAVQAPR